MTGLQRIMILTAWYGLSLFTAGLLSGIVSLVLALNLVTVQGPTQFSRTLITAAYYIGLSLAAYCLFRAYAKRQPTSQGKAVLGLTGVIVICHAAMVIVGGRLPMGGFLSGSFPVAHFLYNGWGYLESVRDVPPIYIFGSLFIEDICFAVFSWFGATKGSKKKLVREITFSD